jgi:hypothetical protein
MANIGNQSIGNLNLFVKQGNTQTFRLAFNNVLPNGDKEPIDLEQYTDIKMDVKTQIDVNAVPFISWTVGDGLTIEGDDDNVLAFTFSDEFLESQGYQWDYDILFTDVDGNTTLVGGIINVRRVVTK